MDQDKNFQDWLTFIKRLKSKTIARNLFENTLKAYNFEKYETLREDPVFQKLLFIIKEDPELFARRYLDDFLTLTYFLNDVNLNN